MSNEKPSSSSSSSSRRENNAEERCGGRLRLFAIPHHLRKTLTGDEALLIANTLTDDEGGQQQQQQQERQQQDEMLVFATRDNVTMLSRADIWVMDGTHRRRSGEAFLQVFSIHGNVVPLRETRTRSSATASIVPLVYAVMRGQSCKAYTSLFRTIKKFAASSSSAAAAGGPRQTTRSKTVVLAPAFIMSDYEMALIAAVRKQFPGSIHKGCHGHLCRSVYRRLASEEHLNLLYDQDVDFAHFVRKLPALAFLPPGDIEAAFTELKKDDMAHKASSIVKYFEETYIHGRQGRSSTTAGLAGPRYACRFWSVHANIIHGLPLDQDAIEEWQKRWFALLSRQPVNILDVVKQVLVEHYKTRGRITELLNGKQNRSAPSTSHADADADVEDQYKCLEEIRLNKQHTLSEYLAMASCGLNMRRHHAITLPYV